MIKYDAKTRLHTASVSEWLAFCNYIDLIGFKDTQYHLNESLRSYVDYSHKTETNTILTLSLYDEETQLVEQYLNIIKDDNTN